MKTINLLKKTLVILGLTLIAACGGDGADGNVFIPSFNAQWPVDGIEGYNINLQPNEENKNVKSGVFVGDESHLTDTIKNNNILTGSFNGLNIEFTIQRENGDIQYKGKMTPISDENHFITKIELNSSEGELILSR